MGLLLESCPGMPALGTPAQYGVLWEQEAALPRVHVRLTGGHNVAAFLSVALQHVLPLLGGVNEFLQQWLGRMERNTE